MKKLLLLAGLLSLSAMTAGNTVGEDPHADFLVLGDDKIYYEMSGDGFPLVLVSGGSSMDLRQWDRVTPALVEAYRVIRYDPRGIGLSDNPTVKYSDADDLVRLLDHLDIDRVGLIGLSSSGGFVLEFAIQYPERISGLVAAAPFIPGFEFSAAMLARFDRFNQAAGQGRESFLDLMLDDPHFIPAPLDRSIRTAARDNMGYNFDKGADFDPSLPIGLEPPLIEQLANIHSPVLLMAGELDHPEVLRRNKVLLAQIPSAKEEIIVKAGHNGPLENPDAFLAAMKSFLGSISQ